jgi:hypothetical protein
MTAAATVKSIRCTTCGAPLKLYGGGHKILTLTCEYCGSVMDVRREFEVLHQFKNHAKKPACPLELGMQGEFYGVNFTAIGLIGYHADTAWVDILLYSPTHGYAWLTYEDNHFTFMRRYREPVPNSMWLAKQQDSIHINKESFKYVGQYQARINYVAGELTWLAKEGDINQQADAVNAPHIISADKNAQEIELYKGEYLSPKAVYAAFGIQDKPLKVLNIHPAQPYNAAWSKPFSKVSLLFALLSLIVIILIAAFFSGKTISRQFVTGDDLQKGWQSLPFNIQHPQHRVKLEFSTNSLNNAWVSLDIELWHNNQWLRNLNKELSYYSGYDDESWIEDNSNVAAVIKLPEAGDYILKFDPPEGGRGESDTTSNDVNANLVITVKENYYSDLYFIALLIFCMVGALWYPFAKMNFESKRWQEQAEDDA